jgi:signal transduction histidine kinase
LKSGRQNDSFYKELWSTLKSGRTWKGHFINKRKDGSLFDVDVTISPVKNPSGEITHYVSVKRDTTAQLKTEKQLFQAQKMEAIGTMAGGIAHDFNNILGAISGYTELTLIKKSDTIKIKHYLHQIHGSSRRAVDLVRQILEFSRMTEKELTPVNVIPLFKESVKMLREIMPSTIQMSLNIETEKDRILGDATQVYQILMNLCTNAYQAMKDKCGRLTVTVAETEIGSAANTDERMLDLQPGSYLELTVSENGEGIDPLTGREFLTPSLRQRGGAGTGRAFVVHGIVTGYGVKIVVESQIGVGSTFRVYLPLLPAATVETTADKPEAQPISGKGCILVVDDEKILANVVKEMLEDGGYEVVAGLPAWKPETFSASPNRFYLVLTD